jgi:hypothetical protein
MVKSHHHHPRQTLSPCSSLPPCLWPRAWDQRTERTGSGAVERSPLHPRHRDRRMRRGGITIVGQGVQTPPERKPGSSALRAPIWVSRSHSPNRDIQFGLSQQPAALQDRLCGAGAQSTVKACKAVATGRCAPISKQPGRLDCHPSPLLLILLLTLGLSRPLILLFKQQ